MDHSKNYKNKLVEQFHQSRYNAEILDVAKVDPVKLKGKAAVYIQNKLAEVLGPLKCSMLDYVDAAQFMFNTNSLMRVMVDISDVLEYYGWPSRRAPKIEFPDREVFIKLLGEAKFVDFIHKLMLVEPNTSCILEVSIPKWIKADGTEATGKRQVGITEKNPKQQGPQANIDVQSEMVYYFCFNILNHMIISGNVPNLCQYIIKKNVMHCAMRIIRIQGRYQQFLLINAAAIFLIRELLDKSSASSAALTFVSAGSAVEKFSALASPGVLFSAFRHLYRDQLLDDLDDRILYSHPDGYCKGMFTHPPDTREAAISPTARFNIHRNWVIETAKSCLEALIEVSKKYNWQFIENPRLVTMLLNWLDHPCVSEFEWLMVRNCVKLLINMCRNEKFVALLVKEHNFKDLLKRKIVCGERKTLNVYMDFIHGLVHNDFSLARLAVASDAEMIRWLMVNTASFCKEVQMNAVEILAHLAEKTETAVLLFRADISVRFLCEVNDFYDTSKEVCCSLSRVYKNMALYCKDGWMRQRAAADHEGHSFQLKEAYRLKEMANQYYKAENYRKALELYFEALKISPPTKRSVCCNKTLNYQAMEEHFCCSCDKVKPDMDAWLSLPAMLHSNSAQCLIKLQCYKEAVFHCTTAILWTLTDHAEAPYLHTKSLTRRATAYVKLQEYGLALNDIGTLSLLDSCTKHVKELHDEIMYRCRRIKKLRHLARRCAWCLRGEAVRLKQCKNCGVRFCTMECYRQAWSLWHKAVCAERKSKMGESKAKMGETENKKGETDDKKGETKDKKGEINDKKGETRDKKGETNDKQRETKDKKGETNEKNGETKDKKGKINDKKAEIKDKRGEANDKKGETMDIKGKNKDLKGENKDTTSVQEKGVAKGLSTSHSLLKT